VVKVHPFAYSQLEGVNGKGFKDSRYTRLQKDLDCWIKAMGELLDQNLCVVSCIEGSKVERISFRL
jgi:hypothetical protein